LIIGIIMNGIKIKKPLHLEEAFAKKSTEA
jgi:hypothetical protein